MFAGTEISRLLAINPASAPPVLSVMRLGTLQSVGHSCTNANTGEHKSLVDIVILQNYLDCYIPKDYEPALIQQRSINYRGPFEV